MEKVRVATGQRHDAKLGAQTCAQPSTFFLSFTLKVLSADKTSIDVQVGEGDGADLLKVKVQHESLNSVKIES